MLEVRPLHVITSNNPNIENPLLVFETQPTRLEAGDIVLGKSGSEVITPPGTYLPQHLGKLTIVESWDVDRAAKALARGMFGADSPLFDEWVANYHDDLVENLTNNASFIVR